MYPDYYDRKITFEKMYPYYYDRKITTFEKMYPDYYDRKITMYGNKLPKQQQTFLNFICGIYIYMYSCTIVFT